MNPRPQAPGAKPSNQDPVDWRARSQGLEEALIRIADDDCGSWDQAMRYARETLVSLSPLGLPDEEGEERHGD